MSNTTPGSSNSASLLHPEVLSLSELIDVFSKRGIPVSEDDKLHHHRLVELFYTYILPLPQRKYRPNRTGKLLTAFQNRDKSKPGINQLLEAVKKRGNETPMIIKEHGLVNSPVSTDKHQNINTATRINFKNKKIKLTSSASASQGLNVRKLEDSPSDNDNQSSGEPAAKRPRQKITWP